MTFSGTMICDDFLMKLHVDSGDNGGDDVDDDNSDDDEQVDEDDDNDEDSSSVESISLPGDCADSLDDELWKRHSVSFPFFVETDIIREKERVVPFRLLLRLLLLYLLLFFSVLSLWLLISSPSPYSLLRCMEFCFVLARSFNIAVPE